MLINPFEVKKENLITSVYKKNKLCNNTVNVEDIIKYISTNYSKYLKNENKNFFEEKIKEYIYLKYRIDDSINYSKIIKYVLNKIFGYGLLQKYIEDKVTTDIRVVDFNLIYIKQEGKWLKAKEKFKDKEELREYIKYLAIKNNKAINYDYPLLIASDKEYKLRLEAGINPVNQISDNLVIRMHKGITDLTLNTLLIKYHMIDRVSYNLLNKIIDKKANAIIAGKGGSGKTTLLKAMLEEIPDTIPITVNEETNELFINKKNVIQREIILDRKDNNITLATLLKRSLVMSNDILVVGELKGEETSVFIDAISTGHTGFATLHANSIYSVIDRLILLFRRDKKAEKYSEEFIKNTLCSSIDYIIFLKDFKVKSIGRVKCLKGKYLIDKIYDMDLKRESSK